MSAEITPRDLKTRLDGGDEITLIDVREPAEKELADIGGVLIPTGEVLNRLAEVPRQGTVVVYCRSGGRSGQVVEYLRSQCGYTNLLNLEGGILRWSQDVDPSIVRY